MPAETRMGELGDQIKARKFPVVLYADDTPESLRMRVLLESNGAAFSVRDATADLCRPVAIVDGCLLSVEDLEEVFRVGGR